MGCSERSVRARANRSLFPSSCSLRPKTRRRRRAMAWQQTVSCGIERQADGSDFLPKPYNGRELLARADMQLQLGKKRLMLETLFEERTADMRVLTDCKYKTKSTGGGAYPR